MFGKLKHGRDELPKSTTRPSGEATNKIVKALLGTLSDRDRLVRESGCLALGHLKAHAAVPKILHLWYVPAAAWALVALNLAPTLYMYRWM